MDSLKQKAVGFYWTLPVPWRNFRELPDDIDAAAKKSRTIAYQRELTRRYAKDNGMVLVHEATFLELDPDRGSSHASGALDKAAHVCRTHNALLLIVDFPRTGLWRSHNPMDEWIAATDLETLRIWPDPVEIDGLPFHPHAHFEQWRVEHQAWRDEKPARLAAARARASELAANGARNPEIARQLNAEDLRSATGKPWTAEMLRKVLAAEE